MGTKTCGMCNGVGSKREATGPAAVCGGCNGRGYLHHDIPGVADEDDGASSAPMTTPPPSNVAPGGKKQAPPRPGKKGK